ncbi:MAG TPA: alpha-L-rhamnosidase C-terminal domain-containing protein, partial [Anaerolinea sp.]|nr:alpha-L-rhamnosidase C-terminal domain-containing protein [Anaerolinea sp.]
FPTRSHCHAWSSAPLHFLPRILLGVRPLEPGRSVVEISPLPAGLAWAKGQVATPRGPIRMEWRLEGSRLHLQAFAPPGVSLRFVTNPGLAGLTVQRNF